MGTQDVSSDLEARELRRFTKQLLCDLRALEHMIEQDCFDSGVRRIGAEQELFLIDRSWRAAPRSGEILAELDDPHFTTELAQFNLEFNCDPLEFGGDCLSRLEKQIDEMLRRTREVARHHEVDVVLAGILPTIHKSDLELENMTDRPRYAALNQALSRERGDAYNFRLRGIDELSFKHYSVMLEACNTSFQVHFQVQPHEFARFYNIAQVVTAPVLAAATNSPILFGKRLWSETRIALFQQSIDTRRVGHHIREIEPRVSFGNDWVDSSVLEIFREDISRFKVILGTEVEEDPFAELAAGRPPRLTALLLHNSTVYRWNRPCYGITGDRPHLRIENRVLPAGPTPLDEVANAAFWFGLVAGLAEQHDDIRTALDFDDAKNNFFATARNGLDAQIRWLGGRKFAAQDLITAELVPLAAEGLRVAGVDAEDRDRYLGVIAERVASHRTGSHWILESLSAMRGQGTRGERLGALTAAMLKRQQVGEPVHRWPLAQLEESGGWQHNFLRVEQFMTTDLFTVNEEESIDLVANLMDWKHIRHVPVEDSRHRLVGLVSYRALIRYLGRNRGGEKQHSTPVSEIMTRNIVTIGPETTSLEAIRRMKEERVSCLPVLTDDHLVGLVTEADFTNVARQLLEESLRE